MSNTTWESNGITFNAPPLSDPLAVRETLHFELSCTDEYYIMDVLFNWHRPSTSSSRTVARIIDTHRSQFESNYGVTVSEGYRAYLLRVEDVRTVSIDFCPADELKESWTGYTGVDPSLLHFIPYDTLQIRVVLHDPRNADGGLDYIIKNFEYETVPVVRCGAPTECSLNRQNATGATLYWSGALGMTGYPDEEIYGYEIQRAESSDNETWGEWSTLDTTYDKHLAVIAPDEHGYYYRYRVRTLSDIGEDYHSWWRESSNTLRKWHDPIEGFSDDPLVAGVSKVKALHILELQDRVDKLRDYYNLDGYAYSQIVAGVTSLGDWATHVSEIRAAIDEMALEHEAWIEFDVNCPRADVIEQLRAVVLAL